MQIIELTYPLNTPLIPEEPVVLALGFFDGLHQGHQKVIATAREEAKERGVQLAVMSFNQHPQIVYNQLAAAEWPYLMTRESKIQKLRKLDVDIYYEAAFTYDFGSQSPEEFAYDYLGQLHPVAVVAGADYSYGPPNVANMDTLPKHSQGLYDIVTVSPLSLNQGAEKISSSSIRKLIQESHIEKANQELGEPYETVGTVVHGFKRGRQLGYPTANLRMDSRQLLPGIGIYAVKVKVKGDWYKGMLSVGHNVTFGSDFPLSYEVYLLDFDDMIYGEQVIVRWYHYLRGEVKFTTTDALIHQLGEDEQMTRDYFNH